jgi:hypothetical protein
VAFLLGGGVPPALIGYMGETYTFSTGIVAFDGFMILGPVSIRFLRLGHCDDRSGC